MTKRTKTLLEIQENVNKLVTLLESNEVKKLRKESEELKEIKSLLSHIKFKIKNTSVTVNQETGKTNLVVTYELPRIILEIDENGKPNKNEFFYATNMLNMISLEDMSSFQKVLNSIKAK